MGKNINVLATCERIKLLCEERGYDVKKLQKELGLASPQAVYKWFEGKNIPSFDNLIDISGLLDVPINDLIVIDKLPQQTNDD